MKTVVVGVSSGIAAYKSLDLVAQLRKEGINVIVIMTKSAIEMAPKEQFEKVSGNHVYSEMFEKDFDYKSVLETRHVDHIDIADSAAVFVVAPATANVVAKIAYGIADDFLTTTLLATQAPVIVCPSMNVHMWENPIVKENVRKLRSLGYNIIDPEEGALACGYTGKGRLADVGKIKDEALSLLSTTEELKGKKILITAGATKEKIDAVRFITNRSSGKMGAAIAQVCHERGADALLLRAKNAVLPKHGIKSETFETAEELTALLKKYVKNFDVLFHTAAVADFSLEHKEEKISSDQDITLQLKRIPKLLDEIKHLSPKIKLIGFKATYGLSDEALIEAAKKRLKEANADAIIANDLKGEDRGFQADTNEVIIVSSNGKQKKISLRSKLDIAKESISFLLQSNIL